MEHNLDSYEAAASVIPSSVKWLSRFISWIFSPILMPVYGAFIALWFTSLSWLPERTRLLSLLWTFGISGVLPMLMIGILRLCGLVSDAGLNIRAQRPLPLSFTALCYGVCGVYFIRLHAPVWFVNFFFGATLATVITVVVSTKWKISGHATGVGALVGLVVSLAVSERLQTEPLMFIVGTIWIAGLTGTSRILLGRHTPPQVWAGYANGLLSIMLVSALFSH